MAILRVSETDGQPFYVTEEVPLPDVTIIDRRGQKKDSPEIWGKVEGFIPAGDYVLVKRLKSIEQDGMIVRPEVAVELSERGYVIAVSKKAENVPLGFIATFSKYGAEEKRFDDEGQERYALVRTSDIRGWHAGS